MGHIPQPLPPKSNPNPQFTVPNNTTTDQNTSRQRRAERRELNRQAHEYINHLKHQAQINENDEHQPRDTTQKNNKLNMNTTPTLPILNTTNYPYWYDALSVHARTLKADYLLNEHIPIATDPAEETQRNEHADKLRQFIIPSLPPDIVARLPPTILRETPYTICSLLRAHIHESHIEDHEVLDAEARSTKYLPGTEFSDYVDKHLDIRQKMITAQYPNIGQERTTVNYMIQGLAQHPELSLLTIVLAGNPPNTIRQFTNHVRQVALMQARLQAPTTTTHIPTALPQQTLAPYPTPAPQAPRRTTRGPYQPRSHTRPKGWTGKWCTHHGSITHDTENCYTLKRYRQPRHTANLSYDQPPKQEHESIDELYRRIDQLENALEQQHLEEGKEGKTKFILDSGANPTHVYKHHQGLKRTKNQLTTTATGQQCRITHRGQLTIIQTPKPIRTNAVLAPRLKHNLLSVRDLTRHGHVTFTPTKATLHKPTDLPKPILTAQYQQGLYRLSTYVPPTSLTQGALGTSLAARAVQPSSIRSKTNKNKGNRTKQPCNSKTTTTTPTTQAPTPTHPATICHPISCPTRFKTPSMTPPQHRAAAQTQPTPPTPASHKLMHEWHLKLGHIQPRTIATMARNGLLPTLPKALQNNPPKITCSGCLDGKTAARPHRRTTHTNTVGLILSSDVCGPMTPASAHGNKYFITFVDAASRYLLTEFLPTRSHVPHSLTTTIEAIRRYRDRYPSTVTTDNAKEYLAKYVQRFLQQRGITFKPTTPYTPQENALAERVNRTLMNSARAALAHSQLPAAYWEDAVRDATYKYNLTYHHTIQNIPYTLWHGRPPQIDQLFIFGQLGSIPILKTPKTKLQLRAHPARYMYGLDDKHIRVHNLTTKQYQTIRTTNFTPYHRNQDPTITTTAAFAMQSRKRTIPKSINITTPPPRTRTQANKYPDASEWARAHNEELDQLDERKAIQWASTRQLPDPTEIIPMTMTYRYKTREQYPNQMTRKARCSVRGDLMQPHIHYDPKQVSTFMAEKASIRLILALAAANNMHLEHFDITGAYLHEQYLHNKPVFVWQPKRFDGSYKHPQRAGELKGNVYGTPPAAYIYATKLHDHLSKHGYQRTHSDPSLYTKKQAERHIIIAVSMDDFLTAATTPELNHEFYTVLNAKYKVKRLGQPSNYLNWNIQFTEKGIHVSQPHHIQQVAKYLKMENAAPQPTPYLDGCSIDPQTPSEESDKNIAAIYRSALGEIWYIADSTRPDMAFVAAALARATKKPTARHWQHMKRAVRYLLCTPQQGLLFPNATPSKQLTTYSDAYYANDLTTRKSFSGIIYQYNGGSVHWQSRQQPLVAQSTCEAEYIAAAEAAQGTIWLKNMLGELRFTQMEPTTLNLDNSAAIRIAEKNAPTKRRKCIDVKYHLLQDLVHNKVIKVKYIPSSIMRADALTKTLKQGKYEQHRTLLGVQPPHATNTDTKRTLTTTDQHSTRQGDCDSPQKDDQRRVDCWHRYRQCDSPQKALYQIV